MRRQMTNRMDRRDFLRYSVWAGAGAATLALPAFSAPIQRRAASQRVIIIGAGLAGMAAAFELVQAGHHVTILEARMRAGGRVQTLREPFSDGMYAEAGAMYVPDSHDWTMKYIKLFDVPLDPVPHATLSSILRLRGRQVELKPNAPVHWPFNLKPDEREVDRRGLWQKYVIPVLNELDNDLAPDWPPASLKQYDRITFAEFLRRRGASPDAVAIMNLGLASGLGDGAEAVAALDLLREAAHREQTREVSTIKGGSDVFPLAFAKRLADKIEYGAPVLSIAQHTDRVSVIYSQAGRQH